MGTYSLEGILLAWKTEKLTTEQAIGQMLQLLQELERRVTALEQIARPARPLIREGQKKSIEKA